MGDSNSNSTPTSNKFFAANPESECKHDHVLERILKDGVTNPEIILDVGCGSGTTTKKLADQFSNSQVIGFDDTAERIEVAKAKNGGPRTQFIKANFNLPWEELDPTLKGLEGKVDLIWCHHVLHCFPDRTNAVTNMGRLIRPGGRAYVTNICMRNYVQLLPPADQEFVSKYVHIKTKDEQIEGWKNLFVNAGFGKVDTTFKTNTHTAPTEEGWNGILGVIADFWRIVMLPHLDQKLQEEIMDKFNKANVWGRSALTKYGDKFIEHQSESKNQLQMNNEEIGIVAVA